MDETGTRTVLERLTKAGISEERARAHIAAGRVRVDDEIITDPDTPGNSGAGPGIYLDPA